MAKRTNWLPWLIVALVLAWLGGRIIVLMTLSNIANLADPLAAYDASWVKQWGMVFGVGDVSESLARYKRFDQAFFTRAYTEAFKLGSLYALIALGYTMVYGIIRLINFAHGEVFMVGAFITYYLFTLTPYPWWAALLLAVLIAYGFSRLMQVWRNGDAVTTFTSVLVGALAWLVLSGGNLSLGVGSNIITLSTSFLLLVFFAMLITSVLGLVIDQVAYKPLRTAPRNSLLITAIAVSFFLQNAGILVFTNRQTPFRPETVLNDRLIVDAAHPSSLILYIPLVIIIIVLAFMLRVQRTAFGKVVIGLMIAGAGVMSYLFITSLAGLHMTVNWPISPEKPLLDMNLNVAEALRSLEPEKRLLTTWLVVVIPLTTAALVACLTYFVNGTRLGKAMRASAQDAETAQMMGVSVDRVIATTFLLGTMLAAAGGAMWGLNFGSLNQPAIMGILPGIKAFAAAVIGGIGSLPGAVIGAMIIGFAENFLTAVFPKIPGTFEGITEFKDTFAFVLLILVLLIKPSGIVGEDLSEKV